MRKNAPGGTHMKTVLDKSTLVETARSKATASKVGFVIFCLIFGLFIVVMALVSWFWAIPFAAFVVLIGAQAAMGTLTFSTGGIAVLNAALVSLADNGGYDLLERIKNGQRTG